MLAKPGRRGFSILAVFLKRPVTSWNVVERPVRCESAECHARLAPEGGWRKSGQRAEFRAERTQAFVAKIEADIRDAVVLRKQPLLSFLDAPARDKLVRGLAKRPREHPIEVKRRQAGLPR